MRWMTWKTWIPWLFAGWSLRVNGLRVMNLHKIILEAFTLHNFWHHSAALPRLAVDHLFSVTKPDDGGALFYVGEKVAPTYYFPKSYRPFVLLFYDEWGRLIMEAERGLSNKLCCWGADIFGNVN